MKRQVSLLVLVQLPRRRLAVVRLDFALLVLMAYASWPAWHVYVFSVCIEAFTLGCLCEKPVALGLHGMVACFLGAYSEARRATPNTRGCEIVRPLALAK